MAATTGGNDKGTFDDFHKQAQIIKANLERKLSKRQKQNTQMQQILDEKNRRNQELEQYIQAIAKEYEINSKLVDKAIEEAKENNQFQNFNKDQYIKNNSRKSKNIIQRIQQMVKALVSMWNKQSTRNNTIQEHVQKNIKLVKNISDKVITADKQRQKFIETANKSTSRNNFLKNKMLQTQRLAIEKLQEKNAMMQHYEKLVAEKLVKFSNRHKLHQEHLAFLQHAFGKYPDLRRSHKNTYLQEQMTDDTYGFLFEKNRMKYEQEMIKFDKKYNNKHSARDPVEIALEKKIEGLSSIKNPTLENQQALLKALEEQNKYLTEIKKLAETAQDTLEQAKKDQNAKIVKELIKMVEKQKEYDRKRLEQEKIDQQEKNIDRNITDEKIIFNKTDKNIEKEQIEKNEIQKEQDIGDKAKQEGLQEEYRSINQKKMLTNQKNIKTNKLLKEKQEILKKKNLNKHKNNLFKFHANKVLNPDNEKSKLFTTVKSQRNIEIPDKDDKNKGR